MMGGQLDWTAVPVLAEILDVRDVDNWVHGLVRVRGLWAEQQQAERDD